MARSPRRSARRRTVQSIDNAEIIETVDARRQLMIPVGTSLSH